MSYDDKGERILKKTASVNEYYLRDHTGRELVIYDLTANRIKMANIFGNGLIGRVDVNWIQTSGFYWDENHMKVFYTTTTRSDDRCYYLKDHLGSNRMTINSLGVVTNVQDYYAYGEVLRSYNNSTPNEKYKFTGKERDTETDLDYFGARFYDSELGRWTSIDPLASKFPQWSPYNYCKDNPLVYIDPNGMEDVPWTAEDLSESLQNGADGFSWVKKGYRSRKNAINQVASAAAYAYSKTNWQNQKHEWGCYIVQNVSDNTYGFTDFTEGKTNKYGDEIWKDIPELEKDIQDLTAAGLKVVGFWHQHPSSNRLSDGDMIIGANYNLDVYATFPNGDIGHFDPQKYWLAEGDALDKARAATRDNLYNHPKLEILQPFWSK